MTCYNFSIANDLTQMVNFPTWIPDCDFHSPTFFDLFLSSGGSICSAMAFPPLGNFDHVTNHGSSLPLILGGEGLNISDQNNWGGGSEQKIKFRGGGAKFKGVTKILGRAYESQ